MDERPAPMSANHDAGFFGHPRGLAIIVAAETCYSFAYWGLVSILTLYLTRQLFTPGHVEHILGFGLYRAAMEAAFGKMSYLGLASQTYGLVTGLMYVTPILGGILADRFLGQKPTVTAGMAILTAGYALAVTEAGFLIAMLLLVIGAGCVKSVLLGQLGRLYGPDDPRRTRAFGWFLIAVNIGGFAAPMAVGTLGEKADWRLGLIVAAAGMAVGLIAYLAGLPWLPRDARLEKGRAASRVALSRRDLLVTGALLSLLIPEILNVSTYNQAFNIFPVWAKDHVNLNLFGFSMPVTWFSTLDGILTIAATAAAIRLWGWLAARGREPGDAARIAVGCGLTTAAFLCLTLGVMAAGAGKTAIVWPLLFFVFADNAIPWVDTVIMALISKAAPPALTTTLLGVYYLSFAVGNFAVGWLGRLYETLSPAAFWGVHAAIIAVAVVFMALASRPLTRMLASQEPEGSQPEPAAA
jgi:POT family proton-dependent oligopeptide transporter